LIFQKNKAIIRKEWITLESWYFMVFLRGSVVNVSSLIAVISY